MIERQIVDGRPATIAYLNTDMTPSDFRDAPLVKIIFDDGETRWLGPAIHKGD